MRLNRKKAGLAAQAPICARTLLEDTHGGRPVSPAQAQQDRGRVVSVPTLTEAAIGINAVNKHVAAGCQSAELEILTLEECGVVVPVAD